MDAGAFIPGTRRPCTTGEALHVAAITTGLRQSELLGLKWQDVDLQSGVLHVPRNIRRVPGLGFEGEPKSRAGRRTVALTPIAVSALHRHGKRRLEQCLVVPLWQNLDLVSPSSAGKPIEPQNLATRHCKPMRRSRPTGSVLPRPPPSGGHLLIALGANDKAVRQILGHSDSPITMNVYAHFSTGSHSQTGETTAARLSLNAV